jgi:hypothetical protein
MADTLVELQNNLDAAESRTLIGSACSSMARLPLFE